MYFGRKCPLNYKSNALHALQHCNHAALCTIAQDGYWAWYTHDGQIQFDPETNVLTTASTISDVNYLMQCCHLVFKQMV